MLCSIEEGTLGLTVRDLRRNPWDRNHLMPIITPAYPCMNSSYNVTNSTLLVMTEQLKNANKICENIIMNKADWSALFEPYRFFKSHRNYLQIDIVAANEDDLRTWKGWVESRLRQLTLKIERVTCGALWVHPYPSAYSDLAAQRPHCAFFMGLRRTGGVPAQGGERFDIRGPIYEFKHSVGSHSLWKPGMNIYVSYIRHTQIPSYVFTGGAIQSRSVRGSNQRGTRTSESGNSGDDYVRVANQTVATSPGSSNGNSGNGSAERCGKICSTEANKRKRDDVGDMNRQGKRGNIKTRRIFPVCSPNLPELCNDPV